MEYIGWNTLLFASKWFFIGLVYFALFIILIAVRRELSYRVKLRQPGPPTTNARLKVVEAGADSHLRAGAIIVLYPETMIGAGEENDIVLEDSFVSGQHARLSWDGSTWWVKDLGSRNGTFINQQRCPPQLPIVLPPGGLLQVGSEIFQLITEW